MPVAHVGFTKEPMAEDEQKDGLVVHNTLQPGERLCLQMLKALHAQLGHLEAEQAKDLRGLINGFPSLCSHLYVCFGA